MTHVSENATYFFDKNGWNTAQRTFYFSNAAGYGAAGTPITFFTVSGLVKAKWYALCTYDLQTSGAATITLGTAKTTAGIIASTTASGIDTGEMWIDATADSVEAASTASEKLICQDVIGTVSTANITGGTAIVVLEWIPVSRGSYVI